MTELREYSIHRIPHPVLDQGLEGVRYEVIYRAKLEPGTPEVERLSRLERLDAWILKQEIEWRRKDSAYWKALFQRAAKDTFIPGEGVFHYLPGQDIYSTDPRHNMTGTYWSRLLRHLPVGEDRPEHNMWSKWMEVAKPSAPYRIDEARRPAEEKERQLVFYDGVPRTHGRWLRILRFWIRTEAEVLEAGARRNIEDYPPDIQHGLKLAIRHMTKDLDYVDNVRFAQTSKPGEMRRFKRARERGCCGSKERYVIIGTKQYIIGCNYGH